MFEVIAVPTDRIKFFLRRSRNLAAYARLKQSIADIGLKIPIGVRSISERPKHDRRKRIDEGGLYEYELVYGQGRLQAFRELRIAEIPAVVVDVCEEEIAARFLIENVMRRRLSWREKAELISYDVKANNLTIEELAEKYCITQTHAQKYLRLIEGASAKVLSRAETDGFTIADVEKLTSLSIDEQDVVMDVLDSGQLNRAAITGLVDRAKDIRRNRRLTPDNLRASLNALDDQLREARNLLKVRKLEFALGPQHLFDLARNSAFRQRVQSLGIDIRHFMEKQ